MATQNSTSVQARNRFRNTSAGATTYMLAAVAFFGLVPLVIALGGDHNPFLYGATMRLGIAAFVLALLLAIFWRVLGNGEIYGFIRRRFFSPEMGGVVASYFDFAVLGLAFRWADPSAGAVFFELSPLLLIFIVARWTSGRQHNVHRMTLLMLFIALIGIVFVLASQTNGFTELGRQTLHEFPSRVYVGLALALAAAFITAFAGFSWVWSHNTLTHADIPSALAESHSEESLGLFFLLVAALLANLVAAALNGVVGVGYGAFTGEWLSPSGLLLGVIGGILSAGIAGALWNFASTLTRNLGIHSLTYGTPILSLAFLAFAGQIGDINASYLIIGTAAIITSNLIINFEAEVQLGFEALILGLGTCGAIVYMRDHIFEFIGVVNWQWNEGGYFGAVALSATIFALLLAFRVARMSSRTTDEDNRTFSIFRKVDLLQRRGVVNSDICNCILGIDQADNPASLKMHYVQARRHITAVDMSALSDFDLQALTEVESELDGLIRSKQVDIHLGEIFALGIFGSITIGLALFSLPLQVVDGWKRFLVDIFAMVISAVVVFLLAHAWDLQRERDEHKLEPIEASDEYRHYEIRFPDTQSRMLDISLSIVVGTGLIVIYIVLLGDKWVGWFS
ncbi:MAG: hypothetical protein OXI91_15025 [Chloroflexota bacterium]|nr:hypothetical protein [Chloroflexota bacterium]